MANLNTRKLCTAALLMATGIILPEIFHMVGGPAAGGLFLPMHLPVLIAGFLLGPFYGVVVAVASLIISFLLTGMPAAAMLPFMLIQLLAFGLLSGLLGGGRWNLYVGLILTLTGGRLIYAVALLAAATLFRLNVPPVATVVTATVTGLPGIVTQLILVPAAVFLLRKVIRYDRTHEAG